MGNMHLANPPIMTRMFSDDLIRPATELMTACRAAGLTIASAESCTGGLIAACLTDIAGSSDVFDRGFVTYSNQAKTQMLGVPAELIAAHGAVSKQVVLAMADGALTRSGAGMAVAVTGIAGPGGGTEEKPVGLVHIAAQKPGHVVHHQCNFANRSRQSIRKLTVLQAFELLNHLLKL